MKRHFFDVGANVGQTFDDYLLPRAAELTDTVIWCFEPSPRHLPALMAKVATLGLDVRICPFGLGGKTATPVFFQKDDPRGDSFSSYLASDHLTQNLKPGYTLHGAVFSVADFILANTDPADRITLKVDCEGSEYALLAHLLQSPEALDRIDRIMVEFHTIAPEPVLGPDALQWLFAKVGRPLGQWAF